MADKTKEVRNLPDNIYGGFDLRVLADGSKRYRLPHTLSSTVFAIVTSGAGLAVLAGFSAFAVFRLGGLAQTGWLGAAGIFIVLHLVSMLCVALWAAFTGFRHATVITIRPDGLIWNDHTFFPAAHIWRVGYGVTINEGKADETFEPCVEILLGTRTIVLAATIDPIVGQLFMRLFFDDTRRYWHGHN